MNFSPLAQPRRREKHLLTHLHELPARKLTPFRFREVPQREKRKEIRILVLKLSVLLICRLLAVDRSHTRVLDLESCGNHEHVRQTVFFVTSQDHASDPRIHGQLGERATEFRQSAMVIDCSNFKKRFVAFSYRFRSRRVEERYLIDFTESQILRLQNHRSEIRSTDFRRCKFGSRNKILFAE